MLTKLICVINIISSLTAHVSGYITCSEFGLTELELLELLMPTSNSEAVITLKDANFNFSTLCVAKYMMSKYGCIQISLEVTQVRLDSFQKLEAISLYVYSVCPFMLPFLVPV